MKSLCLVPIAACLLGACAIAPGDPEGLLASTALIRDMAREVGDVVEVAPFSRQPVQGALPEDWQPYIVLPSKPRTEYRLVGTEEGTALEARAAESASGLYRRIRIDPRRHPHVEWRWRIGNLIPGADKRHAASEDSPARLIVSFHGDPATLEMGDRVQMRLAKAVSGQGLPYATLMYVWSNGLPAETVISNPHTDRIRMIVVGSGAEGVGRWRQYRRDVLADYRRAFGEDPWDIVAVGVMTDTDNTRQAARTHYGDILFRAKLGSE